MDRVRDNHVNDCHRSGVFGRGLCEGLQLIQRPYTHIDVCWPTAELVFFLRPVCFLPCSNLRGWKVLGPTDQPALFGTAGASLNMAKQLLAAG